MKAGFRVADEKTLGEKVAGAYSDVQDVATAALAGGERGATAGLSDVLLPSAEAKAAGQLQAEQPVASTAGELVGMFTSPVNEIAKPIEGAIGAETALGRIGSKVVSQAPVGALFGAGNTLSDSALGDVDLTGERLLAGAGLGALLGGAGGGLGGILDEGLSALPKAAKSIGNAQETLKGVRDMFGLKAAGAMTKEFRQAAYLENGSDLVDLLISKGVLRPGDVVEDVARKSEELAATTGAKQGALAKTLSEKGATVDAEAVASKVDDLAATYAKGNVGDQSIAKRLEAEAEALRARGKLSLSEAEDVKRGFDKYLEWGAEQSPVQEALKKVRGTLNGEIEASAAKIPGDEFKDWLQAKKEMGLLAQVRDFSRARAEALKANRAVSLTDYMSGGVGAITGAAVHGPVGAAIGAGLALGNKLLRERLPGVIAHLADSISKSPVLETFAQSFASKLAQNAPHLGDYAPRLLRALDVGGPRQALAEHMALSQVDPQYQQQAQMAGFLPETPQEHEHALAKAHTIAALATAAQKTEEAVGKGVEKVLRGGSPALKSPLSTQDFGAKRMRRADGLDARMREARDLAANPNALVDRLATNLGPMAEHVPGLSVSLASTAQRAIAYLSQEAQQPVKKGPLQPDWKPSEAEAHDFQQKLEVVQDPMAVLTHAQRGTLTEGHMQAIRAVYPKLAQEIQMKALDAMTTAKGIPYRQRLMLYTLTGSDPDGTMGPIAVARNQSAIQANRRAMPSPGAPQKSPLSLSSRMATPGQKLEMKSEEA